MGLENQRENELVAKAKELFDKGEYKKAQTLFTEVIEINGKQTESFFYLGNIFHIKGDIGKAVKAFSKVLELDPGHTDAAISLSVLYNDIGRYDQAKAIFDRANEKVKKKNAGQGNFDDPHINKKFSMKHYELADLYFSYNRYDEALFEYNKASALDPSNMDVRIKIAKVYAKKGFMSKAFEELTKLKNEFPGFLPAKIALGLLYYANGNVLEAQTQWQHVLAKDPLHQEASMYLKLSKTATETNLDNFFPV